MTKTYLWLVIGALLSLTTSTAASTGFGPLAPSEIRARLGLAPVYNASDLIAEVNALRASNGLPAYNVNSILMQVAQAHADYQASIGTTTHYGADGSRPFQRALAAGYPVAGDLARGGFFSENVTSGSNKTPAQAVLNWQRDAAHLNTMLSPSLQDVGAGVSVSGGVTYYTLDAGSSTGSTINYTPPAGGVPGDPGALPPLEIVQPVVTSTALEDGSLLHEVKSGQALWSIALAYGTTIDELKRLNQLATNEIYTGQKLLIRAEEPVTGTLGAPTATVTKGVPASTPTKQVIATATATSTPEPAPPVTRQRSGAILVVIIVGALVAAGIGTWLSTKKPA